MTIIVCTANILILLSSHQIDAGNLILVLGSILSYFAVYSFVTRYFRTFDNFGSAEQHNH